MQKIPAPERSTWSKHWVFILACIGSAVGLGNIWRFPYMVGLHGGGTFILLYLIAVVFVGLPALLVELTAGKSLRAEAVTSFKKMVGRKWWVVAFPLALCLLILSYYLVVMGWTLFYTCTSLTGEYLPFSEAANSWFLPAGGVVALLLVQLVSRMEIKDGLEKVNIFLFPVFFAALLLILANASTLPGFGSAISYITTVHWDSVLSPINILNAITQAVFSLSVGMAVMLTYGSYLSKKEEVFHSSLAIAAADSAIAIIGALIIFTVTFTFSIPAAAGPQLAFESLPLAFLSMPYGGILMFIFFILLFSAAMTSAVSLSEVLVDNLKIKLKSRSKASIAMLALLLVFFIPSALSYSPAGLEFNGVPFLEFMDAQVVGQFAPLIVAAVLIAFSWGWKDCRAELKKTLPRPLVEPIYLMVKYVAPTAIIVLQAAEIAHELL